MKKKKLALLFMTGVLAVSLTACQGKSSGNSKVQTDKKAMGDTTNSMLSGQSQSSSAYKQVLNNSKSFMSTDQGGKETYLNQFKYDGTSEMASPYSVTRFAYLDLDLDGQNEVVLELDTGMDGAYEILKEIDGTVYGYYFNYRSISPLYADGSMMGSSGAADSEIYRLQFSTTGCTETDPDSIEDDLDDTEDDLDDTEDDLDDTELDLDDTEDDSDDTEDDLDDTEDNLDDTEDDLDDMEDDLDSSDTTGTTKSIAEWYEFTTSNIDMVLGDDSQDTASGSAVTGSALTYNQESPGYVCSDSNERYLTEDEVKYLPKDILKVARNEVFARHGYQFETNDMKTFFENKSWYVGTVAPSDWKDDKLNTYEKKNVELFQKYETLGSEKPFAASQDADGTLITGDDFTFTLPSVWNDSNYFAMKTKEDDKDVYSFYSKHNYMYGYGGHVFSLLVYHTPTTREDIDFHENLVSLGNDGENYYFLVQSTDVQSPFNGSDLDAEWQQLNDTYEQIADSFSM